MEERGVISVAIGKSYRDMAVKGLTSVRKFWSGPILLISDKEDPRIKALGVVTKVVSCERSFATRFWKTQVGLIAPFKHAIFIDCDVLVVNSFDRLWYEPHRSTLAICSDLRPTLDEAAYYSGRHYRYKPEEVDETLTRCGTATPHYNSGIFVWKRSYKAKRLFKTWHRQWKTFKMYDQFALARSIAIVKPKIRELPNRYNASPAAFKNTAEAAKASIVFLHFFGQTKKQFMDFE